MSDQLTWSSADASVASVNTMTGQITATGVGATTVKVSGKTYGSIDEVAITVLPP